MLYRFKSKASGDVVMLQPNGKQLLEILGKDRAGPGIILPEQIPAAIKILQDAVFEDEAAALAWRKVAEHAAVQAKGRAQYYESYTLFAGSPTRIHRFGPPQGKET